MFNFFERIERKRYLQLFFLTIAVHLLMLKNDFTFYSDDVYVLYNPIVKHFSLQNLQLMFTTYFDGHYHPLTLLTLAINYALSGDNAISYNITNLLIHACNVVLIFVFIKLLFKRADFAFAVALLWAVHPFHVESVARITDRKDTQYVFFVLLTLINYINYKDFLSKKLLVYTCITFILALLSKGQALILPLLLLLIEIYYYKAKDIKPNFKVALMFFPISIAFAVIAYRAQLYTGYLSQTESISLTQIIFYPSCILSNYITKFFIPLNLSAQYTIPKIEDINTHYYLLIIPLLSTFAIIWLFIKKRYLSCFGLIFYLVTVVIMLRIIPIAENFMPDRYNYLPSLGLCIVTANFYFYFKEKYNNHKMIMYLAYFYLTFLSINSFLRVTVWQNGLTIWQDANKKQPNDTDVLQNLGEFYFSKNKFTEAIPFFKQALECDSLNILARYSLYKTYKSISDDTNAEIELKKLFSINTITSNQIGNQAIIYADFYLYDKAIFLNNKALIKHPLFIKFQLNNISYQLYKMNFAQAIKNINTLLEINPYCTNVLYELKSKANIALFNTLDTEDDIKLAEQTGSTAEFILGQKFENNAVKANYKDYFSDDYNGLINAGKRLYNQKVYINAVLFFEKCEKIKPNDESSLNNICACYYNLSRPDKVKQYYSKILASNYKRNSSLEAYLLQYPNI